ncbi:mechanosensitive ion channel family protein [bacterium]|nr:mechanosensitive ion channel family protein [bacterium]
MEKLSAIWQSVTVWKFSGLILAILTVIALVIIYRRVTNLMRNYAIKKAHKQENVLKFLFAWRYSFMFISAFILIVAFSGSLSVLGISLVFVSTVISWGLRNPIMNLAAWLLIMLRRPFKIGDRIIIGGLIGDVKDISLNYIFLEQVGGTIGGEEKSGRALLVPNLYMFNHTIVNYTLDEKYILDEVPVRITYNSDYFLAEEIMLKAAKQITADIIEEIGEEPYVRAEFMPSGIIARLRYKVLAIERQRIHSKIVNIIFEQFAQTDKVRFCYNKGETLFNPKDETQSPPPQHPKWLEDGLIRPWFSATKPTTPPDGYR